MNHWWALSVSGYFGQDNKTREQVIVYFCDPLGWERKKNVAFLGKYFQLQSPGL